MSLRLHHVLVLCLVVGLAAAVIAGCGGPKKAATPEEAAQMLIAAAAAGDMKAAGNMIAWDAIARQGNGDWDTLSKNDRQLIIDKEKEMNAANLQKFTSALAGAQVGQSQVQGDTAQVAVSTSSGQFTLQAANSEDAGWKILMPAQL